MTEGSFESFHRWSGTDGRHGPVTCLACGCRLTPVEGYVEGTAWRHFPGQTPWHDARGCRPRCAAEIHGRDGRVLEVLDQVATLVDNAEGELDEAAA